MTGYLFDGVTGASFVFCGPFIELINADLLIFQFIACSELASTTSREDVYIKGLVARGVVGSFAICILKTFLF